MALDYTLPKQTKVPSLESRHISRQAPCLIWGGDIITPGLTEHGHLDRTAEAEEWSCLEGWKELPPTEVHCGLGMA